MASYLVLWFRPRPPGLGLAPVRKILPRSRKGSVTNGDGFCTLFFRLFSLDFAGGVMGHLKILRCVHDKSNRVHILEH